MLQRHHLHQQQHKLEHLHQDQPHLVHLSEFWQLYHHPVLQSRQFCQNMQQIICNQKRLSTDKTG